MFESLVILFGGGFVHVYVYNFCDSSFIALG